MVFLSRVHEAPASQLALNGPLVHTRARRAHAAHSFLHAPALHNSVINQLNNYNWPNVAPRAPRSPQLTTKA